MEWGGERVTEGMGKGILREWKGEREWGGERVTEGLGKGKNY